MAFVDEFRAAFPEFADQTSFPDAQILFWLGLAELSLDERRWGKFYPYGLMLFVAHFLALAKQNEGAGKVAVYPAPAAAAIYRQKRWARCRSPTHRKPATWTAAGNGMPRATASNILRCCASSGMGAISYDRASNP